MAGVTRQTTRRSHRQPGGVSSESTRKCVAEEATISGIILLVFLALIVAFFWNKLRGRAGMKVSPATWAGAIVVFVLLVLMMFASAHGR
jgi:succinate dehydrogenase hydrophobic anchor subunit